MDERGKSLHNIDMLDIAMSLSQGGLTKCLPSIWRGECERYQDAKLYFPVEGRGWIAIGSHVTRLRPGALYLVPPQAESSYGTEKGITISWIHFQPHSPALYRRLMGLSRVYQFPKAMVIKWEQTCRLFARLFRTGSLAEACRIQAMLLDCLGVVLPALPEESAIQRLNHERLRPAWEILNGPLTNEVSLSDLARSVGLSPEHFHRLFQEVYLTTPLRYRTAQQMAAARRLLAEGALTVAEVAAQCGYDNPFYFSRVFRRLYGTTPTAVRRGGAQGLKP